MSLHTSESDAKYKVIIRIASKPDEILYISDLAQLDNLDLSILSLEVTTIMSTEKSLKGVAKGQKDRMKMNLRKFSSLREKKADYSFK